MESTASQRKEMPPRYDPIEAEKKWYAFWEDRGLFKPSDESNAPAFVITIPPPNVTGDLHVGSALTYGIEDLLGRFKRMQGFNALILPGTDHAGIATQNVVEKQLAKEGISRHDLGREKFVERVWAWKDQYASIIRHQFKALGCGFDWSRERFTMDAGYVDAVLEFFIRLFEEGQIYKGWRVINWCVRCHSAISDIEVEDVTRQDSLFHLRYPLKDGSGEIVVATVRPETILGDTAVAVNPNDPRYSEFVGKSAILPLLGRELPIIADAMVDPQFGTGAVKITPAHDFNDFEVGQRHKLPMPIVIAPDATITKEGGPYAGETVEQAKEHVLRDLEAGGFLVRVEPYQHNVPTCERCETVLEPLLSEQWFMDMATMAPPAMDAVTGGDVEIVPARWAKIYLEWMENIRPWTLSRQLWWGHRIPVYYCENSHAIASKSWPEACTQCGGRIERQDPDVLDTWFSSALWPFAVLGWPKQTVDLEKYYPTSFMNTSSQILYLWITRMVMTGLKFMGEAPFPDVLISPTILNKHGQRMSKSLGTGIDPMELVRQYGADALRFGLVTSGSTHSQEIRFNPDRVELTRNFANKIWNVARLVVSAQREGQSDDLQLETPDRWILSRLGAVVAEVTADLEAYEFSGAGQKLHDFIWSEFADWYLEIAKVRLYDDENPNGQHTVRAVMWSVLDRVVRLMHPYMPFLTEEIWQWLRESGSDAASQLSGWADAMPESVMVAPWPRAGMRDTEAERIMGLVTDIVRSVRATRSEYRVPAAQRIPATIVAGGLIDTIAAEAGVIGRLARLEPLSILTEPPLDSENQAALLVGAVTVYLPLTQVTDLAAERERAQKELDIAERGLGGSQSKLHDERFLARAPEQVVAAERERHRELEERAARLRERLETLTT